MLFSPGDSSAPEGPTPPSVELTPFSFEVVTVNPKGEVVARKPGQAQGFTQAIGDIRLEMVAIPGGSFMMGQTEAEKAELIRQFGEKDFNQYFARELPQHQVTLAAFSLSKYPITQAQYQAIMGNNPANFKGDKRPVEQVSWNDAVEFCDRLSKKLGQPYTLPSEAQWEYACRAGTTTPFHFGETITTDLANYDGNYTFASGPKGVFRQETTEVGSFPPNSFGLSDMHGNVFEWCLDHFHDSYNGAPADGSAWVTGGDSDRRVLRGGSWLNFPRNCRCASRILNGPVVRSAYNGFRVVSVPPRTLG
jgi:formylglycine-generating enzyme required for sulfatase activity